MSEKSNYRLGFYCAVGAAAGFSAKAVFVKLAYALPTDTGLAIDAITLLALRMLFAAPAFGIAALRTRRSEALSLWQWATLGGVGLAGYYGASILDFWGLQYISAGLERLILFTYPSLTVLLGVAFFDKRFGVRDFGALFLTYLGIAVAFAHDVSVVSDVGKVWIGAGLVFASSVAYAIYLVGSGQLIAHLGSSRFTAMAMVVATAATLLHFAIKRPLSDLITQRWEIYTLAAGMALFSTVIPVFMQSTAIKYIGAARTSMVGMLGPVATILLGWAILDEVLSAWQFIGALLVIAGVMQLGRR